ncbi:MAG: hypothetical protein IKG93_08975 [Clostridiales bacterium]|nr:hypothetical protein [Clostridiales bacterium]
MFSSIKAQWKFAFVMLLGLSLMLIAFVVLDNFGVFDGNKAKTRENQKQMVEEAVAYINAKNYDIMYYGDDLDAPASFKVRRIYSFDQVEVVGNEENRNCNGKMLIINDVSGTCFLTASQWERISFLRENDEFIVVYLGNSQFEAMSQVGLSGAELATSNSVLFATNKNGVMWTQTGIADDDSFLPETVRSGLTKAQLPVYRLIMNLQHWDKVRAGGIF